MPIQRPSASRRRRFDRYRLGNAVLGRLGRIGIKVHPFLVVLEKNLPFGAENADTKFAFGFLNSTDLPEIRRLQSGKNVDETRARLTTGKLCFGARDGSRLVGILWCDLDEFNFPPHRRALAKDEAYFFDAYVDPEYRGRHLAPSMRIRCCDALTKMGRTVFWSYTDFFNLPARRFKRTLGAKDVALRLHVELFGRFSKTWTLRRYSPGES